MGDGEVAGSAVEVPMRAKFRIELVKGKSTGWPRFENEREIMTAGIYRPVDDAVRIAVVEMVSSSLARKGSTEERLLLFCARWALFLLNSDWARL